MALNKSRESSYILKGEKSQHVARNSQPWSPYGCFDFIVFRSRCAIPIYLIVRSDLGFNDAEQTTFCR